jgi:hypothetical protein
MDMKAELRHNKRRPINQPIVYSVMDSAGEVCTCGVGRALDFSPNGLMMETYEPIKEEKLRVRITISEGESIVADGILVYSLLYGHKTYRTGIKLLGTEEAVDEFISKLQYLKE